MKLTYLSDITLFRIPIRQKNLFTFLMTHLLPRFLWTLYVNNQNENGLYIYKWDFARTLHLENTSLPVTNAPMTAEILTGLFGASDKVSFEQFRSWLLIHKDATVLSKWLLTEKSYNATQDLETPTFYQSLAGVTHLEERVSEIICILGPLTSENGDCIYLL